MSATTCHKVLFKQFKQCTGHMQAPLFCLSAWFDPTPLRFGARGLILLLGLAVPGVPGDAAAAAASASPPTVTVDLEYTGTGEAQCTQYMPVERREKPFAREPVLEKKPLHRGLIPWGPDTNQFLPFIWSPKQGRLHLDLNRNGDLTDDSAAVFNSQPDASSQTFSNIHLIRVIAGRPQTCSVELSFRSSGNNNYYLYAGQCWYWQSKLTINGKEWQYGMVDTTLLESRSPVAPRYTLLRPWTERERPTHLRGSTPDMFGYTTNLFFCGQAYQLDGRWDTTGSALKYRVAFRETPSRLAELQVSGEHLHRLILGGEKKLTVVADQPKGSVKIPSGSYTLDEIWLRLGEAEAACFKGGSFKASEGKPTPLLFGGPLTNSAQIKSGGHSLEIGYALLGADGRQYRMTRGGDTNPPEVVIFDGARQLAADKFRYG
jgi:hypothetical protein